MKALQGGDIIPVGIRKALVCRLGIKKGLEDRTYSGGKMGLKQYMKSNYETNLKDN